MHSRTTRLKQLQQEILRFNNYLEKLKALSRKFSWYRLFLLLTEVAVFISLFFLYSDTAAYVSLMIFAVIFGIMVQRHNNIDFCIRKTILWIKIKEENAARIEINWHNIPAPPGVIKEDYHPFDDDLNISGYQSLLHLVNLSVSKEGTQLLYKWLTIKEPEADDILYRQSLVKELIPLNRFRDKLHMNSRFTYNPEKENELLKQLKPGSNISSFRKILFSLFIIIPVNIILFILFIIFQVPAFFTIGLLAQLAVYWFNLGKISDLYDKAVNLEDDLGKFSRVLEFIEKYSYSPESRLRKLCATFLENDFRPSRKFKKIRRTVLALGFQKNPFVELLLNIIFPWDFYHAYKLELLKSDISEKLPEWLNTWYKLEALISLANIGYIYPDYSFPVLLPDASDEVFNGKKMGHPLIPHTQNVNNDLVLNHLGQCLIVTGSNMSGKSTFLRTIGLNLALAFSGAPVYASELNTRVFRIFTCIKVNDSVTDGISFFYAEVKRLKRLLDELKTEGKHPLFYLIDEIFRGTNNMERLIGSRSYIRELAGSNSIGLISTHDLELVHLAKEIPHINNYHFKEEVTGDKMIFDYKLNPGPCPTTNALKIMRLEGLPVNPE